MAENFTATPTLVIGLGGTGLKVATFVKKSLFEINRNRLPDRIALMVIDTEEDARFYAGGGGSERDERHATGAVRIEGGEYFPLTGYVRDLGEDIKREQLAAAANPNLRAQQPLRHISNWFPAQYYTDELVIDASIWNLDRGAGRLRQFGRLGLFNRYNRLTQLLQENLRAIRQGGANELYVHIAGSLAGGTGAALFIDIAHLVKQYAPPAGFKKTPIVLGHFVLPEGFHGTPDVQLNDVGVRADFDARCFAALRELTRLQGTTPSSSGGYPIVYKPDGTGPENARLSENLYSAAYLYDGVRPRNPVNNQPIESGLAPSIADTIVAYIDDRSSSAFWAYTVNLRAFYPAYKIPDGQVTYGTVGTYTIELPIYHITEGWSHALARSVLDAILQPEQRDSASELPVALATNRPAGREVQPQKAAEEWLRQKNTGLVAQFATWGKLGQAETGMKHQQAVKTILELNALSWLEYLVPTDSEARDYVNEAQAALQSSLLDKSDTNQYFVDLNAVMGENAQQKGDNLQQQIDEQLVRMLGRMSSAWQREGGSFGKALTRLGNYHVRSFDHALTKWLDETLNGDPNQATQIRKHGKLGYALAVIQQVDDLLKACTRLLKDATAESEDERKQLFDGLRAELVALGGQMQRAGGWRAGGKERRAYRDKADELAQFHKADIALQVAYGLIGQLQDKVGRTITELRKWVSALGTASQADGGAYALLLEGQREVSTDCQSLANAVRWVIGDDEDKDSYIREKHARYSHNKLEELLRDIDWKVVVDKEGALKIDFTLDRAPWERRAGESGQRASGVRNLNTLLERCRKIFKDAWTEMSVVEYLCQKYEDKEKELAERIFRANGYPLEPAQANGEPTMRTTFLRVYKDNLGTKEVEFLQTLRREVAIKFNDTVRSAADSDKKLPEASVAGENSRDPFKLCFLLFGDLIVPKDIRSFVNAQGNYQGRSGQWRQLHILPAETNALQIETRLSSGSNGFRQRRRELREEVVAVLEDADRFHLAMQCLAYGGTDYAWGIGSERGILLHKFIPPRAENPRGWSYWRLTLAPQGELRSDGRIHTPYGLATPDHYQLSDLAPEPDLVQALIRFVCRGSERGGSGRDDGRAIDWSTVETTLQLMIDRNTQHWVNVANAPWILTDKVKRNPDLMAEAHDKAAQIIRLNAYINYLQKELDQHRWAWNDRAAPPDEKKVSARQKIHVQQFVDLLTALRVTAADEKAQHEQRYRQLGDWKGGIPTVEVDLGIHAPEPDPSAEEPLSPISTGDSSATSLAAGEWRCPKCGRINVDEDDACDQCGADRPAADAQQVEPPPPDESELPPKQPLQKPWPPNGPSSLLVCENGHELQPGWTICPLCQAKPRAVVPAAQPLVCENGHELQPGWTICPLCQAKPRAVASAAQPLVCENGHELQPGWTICPLCQAKPRAVAPAALSLVCENGHELQPGWTICPLCQAKPRAVASAAQPLVCENGHELQPGWTICPLCQAKPRAVAPAAQPLVCENGHELQPGWTICPLCQAKPRAVAPAALSLICENGHELQPGWTICPLCQAKPRAVAPAALSLICENGHELQPGWTICPICQAKPRAVAPVALSLICENGHELQPSWTICPICRARRK